MCVSEPFVYVSGPFVYVSVGQDCTDDRAECNTTGAAAAATEIFTANDWTERGKWSCFCCSLVSNGQIDLILLNYVNKTW